MCLYQHLKQVITSLRSVSVTTWRSCAKSLVCGQALQVVTLTFLKTWTLKKSAKITFHIRNPLGSKKIACLRSFQAFIGLQSFTKHHTSIISSLHHLTAQQNFCLNSLPESCLPSRGNCQTCHQPYTVTQVSMKCRFSKTALNCCRK